MTEIELRPVTLEAALLAYQALWHGQVAAILGRPMENADVQPLKLEQHRLLCLLAGVAETDSDPLAHFCEYQAGHVDEWVIDGNVVICPNCQPGMGRFAGGWHDLESVLVGMPLIHEAIKRTLERA